MTLWATTSVTMPNGCVRLTIINLDVVDAPYRGFSGATYDPCFDATAIQASVHGLVRSMREAMAASHLSPSVFGRGAPAPMKRREPRPPPERETAAARIDAWRVRSRRLG